MSAGGRDCLERVVLRTRGTGCVVASVGPPFRTACWPDANLIASELGLPQVTVARLEEAAVRRRFQAAQP